jgi:hypothetical protein
MGANEDSIASGITFDHDSMDPDGRHAVTAHVADLLWDEDPMLGRPEMSGQWLLAWMDGHEQTIDLPKDNRAGAEEEARKLVAARLATGFE